MNKLILLLLSMTLISCGTVQILESAFVANRDFKVIGGDPDASISDQSSQQCPERDNLCRELQSLESNLSYEDMSYYSKLKSRLSAQQKLFYLSLEVSEREAYIVSLSGRSISSKEPEVVRPKAQIKIANPLYERQKNPAADSVLGIDRQPKVEIFKGMSKNEIISLWGEPKEIYVAGALARENEKWVFDDRNGEREVFFESGVVEGWTIY